MFQIQVIILAWPKLRVVVANSEHNSGYKPSDYFMFELSLELTKKIKVFQFV
jgi:hypothetical protein